MKRLKSHNKTNKENIAKAIEVLYKPENDIKDYIRKMLIDRLLWATTEHTDYGEYKKYLGQPYWSTGAIRKLLDNIDNNENLFKDLRHEHSVPKKEIKKRILNLKEKSFKNIFNILDNLGYAVVISKEEDDKINKKGYRSKMPIELPEKPTMDQVFSRYKEAQIRICNLNNRDLKSLTLEDIEKYYI